MNQPETVGPPIPLPPRITLPYSHRRTLQPLDTANHGSGDKRRWWCDVDTRLLTSDPGLLQSTGECNYQPHQCVR